MKSRAPALSVTARLIVLGAPLLAVSGTYGERRRLDRPPSTAANRSTSGFIRVGDAAPMFEAIALTQTAVSLHDCHGRVVVINFWATWCPPCRVEMPGLDAYQAEMGDRIAILGVDIGEPSDDVTPFVRQHGLRARARLCARRRLGEA